MSLFTETTRDGSVIVRVHLQPGAGSSAVTGLYGDALKVRVAAPPVDGRANAACAALLADALGLRHGDVELVSGATSRAKRFRVTGLTAEQVARTLVPDNP